MIITALVRTNSIWTAVLIRCAPVWQAEERQKEVNLKHRIGSTFSLSQLINPLKLTGRRINTR